MTTNAFHCNKCPYNRMGCNDCRFRQTRWYRALFPFLSGWLVKAPIYIHLTLHTRSEHANLCRFRQTSWYRALFPFLSGWLWAKYPSSGIQHSVQQLMGMQLKLSNLHTSVLVPSYELQSSSPFTFWHHHKAAPEKSLTGYVAMRRTADIPSQVQNSCLCTFVLFERDSSCGLGLAKTDAVIHCVTLV